MIEQLPNWINLLFLATTIATLTLFYLSNDRPIKLIAVILAWAITQSVLAYFGFYQVIDTTPPRFTLILAPSVLLIIYGLLPEQRKWVLKHRNIRISTFLHTIRIPMEIVLLYLFIHKMIPELMTFEGRNFDITAGISALIIGYLLLQNKTSKRILLIWNYFGLALIIFILINGLLSAELPFQQFGFEQPNKALNYFPFVLLPAVVVPIVIYTHITDIIKLTNEKS